MASQTTDGLTNAQIADAWQKAQDAISSNDANTLEQLLQGPEKQILDAQLENHFHHAICCGSNSVIPVLVSHGVFEKTTNIQNLLKDAIYHRNPLIVRHLFANGASAKFIDIPAGVEVYSEGVQIIQEFINHGWEGIDRGSMVRYNWKTIEDIPQSDKELERLANIDRCSMGAQGAVNRNDMETLRYLLTIGIDTTAPPAAHSILTQCLRYKNPDLPRFLDLLFFNGVKITAEAFHEVIQMQKGKQLGIVKTFIDHGAHVSEPGQSVYPSPMHSVIHNILFSNPLKSTPASRKRSAALLQAAKLLVDAGADIDTIRDENGFTPLEFAKAIQNEPLVNILLDVESRGPVQENPSKKVKLK